MLFDRRGQHRVRIPDKNRRGGRISVRRTGPSPFIIGGTVIALTIITVVFPRVGAVLVAVVLGATIHWKLRQLREEKKRSQVEDMDALEDEETDEEAAEVAQDPCDDDVEKEELTGE